MGVGEAANAILDLEGVHKHYQTDRVDVHALRGVDLRIATGDYLSIMGPSGSGKSTFLRLVLREERPNSGQVWVAALNGTASSLL